MIKYKATNKEIIVLYTLNEICELLGHQTTRQSLYKKIKKGKLKARKIGTAWFVSENEFKEFISVL